MNTFKKIQLVLLAFTFVGSVQAAPINFTFTDPATLTFDRGVGLQSFSGGFTYDVDTRTLTNVNVTMTGNVNATFIGGLSFWNGDRTIGLSAAGNNNTGGILAFLQFGYRLDGNVSPSLFVSGTGNGLYNTAYGNAFTGASVGGVEVPAEVPEPMALLLLGMGLGGLGMIRKKKIGG